MIVVGSSSVVVRHRDRCVQGSRNKTSERYRVASDDDQSSFCTNRWLRSVGIVVGDGVAVATDRSDDCPCCSGIGVVWSCHS